MMHTIIKELNSYHLKFTVVYFNKKLIYDTTTGERDVISHLLSQGYDMYQKNEVYNVVLLNNCHYELTVIIQEDSDFDIIIVSKENLYQYLEMLKIQRIPECYKEILKKFQDTALYNSVENALYHPEKNFGLQELSAEACMTTRSFMRQFKLICGVSFLEFYRPYKIELAKEMISQGIKINEISDRLGFKERTYFDRIFKKLTGVTPCAYRKGIKMGKNVHLSK